MMADKTKKIVFVKDRRTDRYTVKKLLNMIEPEVGSRHKTNEVEDWVGNKKVQVEIVNK